MADLSVIYRIAADITALLDGVNRGTKAMEGFAGTAKTIAGAVGIGFSAAAVVGFARELLVASEEMVKLSEKTDISIGALQEMKRVGLDTSVSVETMASAVSILQKNIGGHDSGAVGAIAELGLNFDELRQMSPEDQWFEIAKALGKVADQATLVKLGTELMGRGFAEVIPAIKEGFGEIDRRAEATTRTLNEVANAFGHIWEFVKGLSGAVIASAYANLKGLAEILIALSGGQIGVTEATDALTRAQKNLAKEMQAGTMTVEERAAENKRLAAFMQSVEPLEKRLNEQLKESVSLNKKAAEETKKHADAKADLLQVLPGVVYQTHSIVGELHNMTLAIPGLRGLTGDLERDLFKLDSTTFDLGDTIVGTMGDMDGFTTTTRRVVTDGIIPLATSITKHLSDALRRIPDLFIDAFTGGGGVMGALKGIGVSLLQAITRDILAPIWDAVANWAVGIGKAIIGAFAGNGFTMPSIGGIGGGGGAGGGTGAGIGAGIGATIGAGILGVVAGFGINDLLTGNTGSEAPSGWINGVYVPPANTVGLPPFEDPERLIVHPSGLNLPGEDHMRFPSFQQGSDGVQDFGAGTLAMLHGREAVVPERQLDTAGVGNGAVLSVLNRIADQLERTRQTILQIDNKEIARANIKAWTNGADGLLTQAQELLGVT